MTDAEATIRSAILEGLLKVPEVAGMLLEDIPESIVTAILDSVFDPTARWAVPSYAEELNIKAILAGRERKEVYETRMREYMRNLR